MTESAVMRRLIWKETRQLLPLVATIIGVGLLIMGLGAAAETMTPQLTGSATMIPWVLPACYAVGAAILLVGHEKELRTLDWLAALPCPPSRVIAGKLAVALAGLLGMWLLAAVLISFSGGVFFAPRFGPLFELSDDFGLTFILQSLVILFCGFYAAWRTSSILSGLALLVVLSCGPFVVAQGLQWVHRWLTGRYIIPSETASLYLWTVSILWVLLFMVLVVRAAHWALAPAPPPSVLDDSRWWQAWRPRPTAPPSAEPFRYPLSALLWQTVQHQRWLLSSVGVLLLLGAISLALLGRSRPIEPIPRPWYEPLLVLVVCLSGLGVSCLGVMVFAGDGSSRRLRFLADRGVSPVRVWIGRQLVGISLLSASLLCYLPLSIWVLSISDRGNTVWSLASVGLGVWTIYVVSQWVSQALPLTAGSVVVAPIVSAVTLVWASIAAELYRAPMWLLILCSLIPLAATALMMRRYMDGRRGWNTLGSVIAVVLLLVVAPVLPVIIKIARTPDISPQQKEQMLAAAGEIELVTSAFVRWEPLLPAGQSPLFMTGQQLLELYRSTQFDPRSRLHWPSQSGDDAPALSLELPSVEVLEPATFYRVAFVAALDDGRTEQQLRAWVNAIIDLARGARRSQRLVDQTSADLLEIWLVDTLSEPKVRELKGIDLIAASKLLGDREFRSESRRQAVLVSWRETLDRDRLKRFSAEGLKIGGVRLEYDSTAELWVPFVDQNQARINLVAAALLELIELGRTGQPTSEVRAKLQRLFDGIDWDSQYGLYSDQFRNEGTVANVLFSFGSGWLFNLQIGALWYADWEQRADELASELREIVQPSGGEA